MNSETKGQKCKIQHMYDTNYNGISHISRAKFSPSNTSADSFSLMLGRRVFIKRGLLFLCIVWFSVEQWRPVRKAARSSISGKNQ